jgi:hypothetical protein
MSDEADNARMEADLLLAQFSKTKLVPPAGAQEVVNVLVMAGINAASAASGSP